MTKTLNFWMILLFFFTTCISFLFVEANSYLFTLICITLFCFFCLSYVKFEPTHPIVWYLPFIYIYNLSIIFLDLVGFRRTDYYYEMLICSWIALSTSGISLLIFNRHNNLKLFLKNRIQAGKPNLIHNHFLLDLLIFLGFAVGIFFNIIYLILGLSKGEAGQIWYFGLLNYYTVILTVVFIIKAFHAKANKHKFNIILFLMLFGFNLFTALNTGERDMFFSFIVSSFLLLYVINYITKMMIFCVGFIGILLIPVLGALKNIFIRSEINLGEENILISVISGEFISASRNLETLLQQSHNWDYFYGLTFLWDIRRVLTPSFTGINYTSISWFAETFHWRAMQNSQGYGFTLLGEGFINFGFVGIFLIFIFVCALVSYLYQKAHNNYWFLLYYLMSMPFFIYALRADLANIFSPLLKRLFLVFILIITMDYIFTKLKQSVKK